MKFIVLFASLATLASARVFDEAGLPKNSLKFSNSAEGDLGIFGKSTPDKCLPYIKPGYEAAVEARPIFERAPSVGIRLLAQANICLSMERDDEFSQCLGELKKVEAADGQPLLAAYLKIHPTLADLMDKFEKCLGAEAKDIVPTDAQKCLPHVQEAYDYADQLRSIVNDVFVLRAKLTAENFVCMSNPGRYLECMRGVLTEGISDGIFIEKSYQKLRPHLVRIMATFKECLA